MYIYTLFRINICDIVSVSVTRRNVDIFYVYPQLLVVKLWILCITAQISDDFAQFIVDFMLTSIIFSILSNTKVYVFATFAALFFMQILHI